MSMEIINKIHSAKDSLKLDDKNSPFIVKPHPTHDVKLIKEILKNIDLQIQVTEVKSLPALLNTTSVLLTEASSSCLEALSCGIPVIVIVNSGGLSYNPVPKSVSSKIYSNAETIDDIVFALKLFLNRDISMFEELNEIGKKIRNDFFEPITQKGIDRFLHKNIK
jgi:hypothetical protein